MNNKLYVANLATTTTYHELMDLFSVHGNVSEITLGRDRARGGPRGCALVAMATPEGARAAMAALHHKEIAAHTVTVTDTAPPVLTAPGPASDRQPRRTVRHLY